MDGLRDYFLGELRWFHACRLCETRIGGLHIRDAFVSRVFLWEEVYCLRVGLQVCLLYSRMAGQISVATVRAKLYVENYIGGLIHEKMDPRLGHTLVNPTDIHASFKCFKNFMIATGLIRSKV